MKKSVFIVLGVLLLLNVLARVGVTQLNRGNLEVTFFDVGQGDAALIEGTATKTSDLRL